jgi:hypothetical protein
MKLLRRLKAELFGTDADVPGLVVFLLNVAVLAGVIVVLMLLKGAR